MTAPLYQTSPARLRIVPAEVRHGSVLAELEAACFPNPWSESVLAGQLTCPGSLSLVAHQVPDAVGYALLRTAADEGELLRIGVLPEHRSRGIADELLREGLRRLRKLGARLCHLEVREDNPAAIGLYRRHGFRSVGQRTGYYPDGATALLFAHRLAPPMAEGDPQSGAPVS
ncbi:MAG: ribosomal protein S18-alanine N-acetyltransferase [Acidobacteriota bacterium]